MEGGEGMGRGMDGGLRVCSVVKAVLSLLKGYEVTRYEIIVLTSFILMCVGAPSSIIPDHKGQPALYLCMSVCLSLSLSKQLIIYAPIMNV